MLLYTSYGFLTSDPASWFSYLNSPSFGVLRTHVEFNTRNRQLDGATSGGKAKVVFEEVYITETRH
jgi:hypothetical protein